MPFDGKRMFWGGFEKIVDTAEASATQADACHRLTPLRSEEETDHV